MHDAGLISRFWDKIDDIAGPGDCWGWAAATGSHGYGVIGRTGGKHKGLMKAHRLSWEIHNNCCIPAGMVVMHTCDNPPCCNPKHLRLGTQIDNIKDMRRKGRNVDLSAQPGTSNPAAVLSDLDVLAIREMCRTRAAGQREIGRQFNISQSIISGIHLRKLWKHIP